MTRATRLKLKQSGISLVSFIFASLLLFFNDAYFRTAPDLRQIAPYTPVGSMLTYLLGGVIGGVFFSFFEFFIIGKLFFRFGLVMLILGRAAVMMFIYVFMTVLLSFLYNVIESGQPVFSPVVLAGVLDYFSGPIVVINLVFYSIFTVLLVYFHQIGEIVGRGVLGKFLFGRYKTPRLVERVFLFLDINSSTRIAEELGPVRFFALIQDFLVEAGAEILEHGGEINKYVGDEIIAIWPVEEGARRARALACVLAIQNRIIANSDRFTERYGLVPGFKSGLHLGPAIEGELGDWKREIAYMGDALNTTARIQSACKKLGATVLVSEAYHREIEDQARWTFTFMGRARLRGKDAVIGLYRADSQASVV